MRMARARCAYSHADSALTVRPLPVCFCALLCALWSVQIEEHEKIDYSFLDDLAEEARKRAISLHAAR